ncbi:MAG TPA: LamG domain-containing protein, partial [Chloroflexota bacterium]|nr:LamG domain-containing protein [Chloroflexota bacterium]
GCGIQYSDPIHNTPASDAALTPDGSACSGEYVLQFDGTQFGAMTRLIQDDFTIEVWIRTNHSLTGNGPYVGNPVVFADVPDITTDDFGALLNNKFRMTTGNPDTPVTSTSDVTTNQWVHVVATRTRTTGIVLVFVNGTLEAAGTGNKNALAASATISFGGRAGRDFFVGQMADLRLWRTVRSQEQIVANMHRRMQGNDVGLVGYYRLDEMMGSAAHDSSPSQNHATLDGAIWAPSDPPLCGH